MAITGRFDADFEPFLAAAQAANRALENIEGQAKQLNTSMDRLSSSHFFTEQIVEGQLLVDAIHLAWDAVKELTAAIPDLVMQGAKVGDVEEGFRHLAEQAGLTADVLLNQLRAGTHGTIDDFGLMQRANENMAAGLNLTDAQLKLLADGAFALAKVTGGDTKDALDKMSDALVTGRTKAIALLTGKIDLKKVEEDYATTLIGTGRELTAEGKLEVDREAILARVGERLDALGVQHESLDDKVKQAETSWTNFYNKLGEGVAQSKVLEEGWAGLKRALISAFGTDEQDAINNIVHDVESLAIGLVAVGKVAVEMGVGLARSFEQAKLSVTAAMEATLVAAHPDRIVEAFDMMSAASKQYVINVAKIEDTAVKLEKGLDDTAAAMRIAQAEHDKTAAAARGHADAAEHLMGPIDQVTQSQTKLNEQLPVATQYTKQYVTAWDELNKTGTDYHATVDALNPVLVQQIEYYLKAGASVKTLAEAYPQVGQAGVAAIDAIQKAAEKAALDVAKIWNEYTEIVGTGSETAYGKAQAAIDKWYDDDVAKHQASKTDTAAYYEAIAALDLAKYAKLKQNRLEGDSESKASLDKQAKQDEEAYQFALANQDQFSQEHIEKLRLDAEKSRLAAEGWGLGWEDAAKKAAAAVDQVDASINKTAADAAAADAAKKNSFQFSGAMPLDPKFASMSTEAKRLAGYIDLYGRVTPLGQSVGFGYSGMAGGGPVDAGTPYKVGELGPEVFVPSVPGTILPNGAGGGVTVNNVFHIVDTEANIARRVSALITQSVMRSTRLS